MLHAKKPMTALLMSLMLTAPALTAEDASLGKGSGLAADLIVNGQPISQNHVLLMMSGLNDGTSARNVNNNEARGAARRELLTQELLAQEARRTGLDKKPGVADQLAYQDRVILSRAYLEDYFTKNAVTDPKIKAAYEWKRANGKIQEYKVRQILLTSPDQAAEIVAKLDKGEDFAKLAKSYTQDPGGQNNGGDLGWFRPETFIDHHFSDAVEGLKKGQYTKAPVRSRFGWHLIKLEDGPRKADAVAFDALDDGAREALRQKTAQLAIEQLTGKLSASAKVTGPGAGAVKVKAP